MDPPTPSRACFHREVETPDGPSVRTAACDMAGLVSGSLVDRVKHMRVGTRTILPDSLNSFEAEKIRNDLTERLEEWGLKLQEGDEHGSKSNIVIEARPAVDHVVFYADLSPEMLLAAAKDPAAIAIYGVHTQSMASAMVARGYSRVFVDFLSNDRNLPPPLIAARQQAEPVAPASPGPPVAPTRSTLSRAPQGAKPNLFHSRFVIAPGAQTAAAQVTTMWELHTQDD
jgi:hypothetical protein